MPAWSPDGRLSYIFRSGISNHLAIYDPKADTHTRLTMQQRERRGFNVVTRWTVGVSASVADRRRAGRHRTLR